MGTLQILTSCKDYILLWCDCLCLPKSHMLTLNFQGDTISSWVNLGAPGFIQFVCFNLENDDINDIYKTGLL